MAKKSKKNKSTNTENINSDQINESSINEETAMSASAADVDVDFENSDFGSDLTVDTEIFLSEEAESEGFLPDVQDSEHQNELVMDLPDADVNLDNSELAAFESAEIAEVEFVEDEQAESIVESILFASDRPVSLASIVEVFKGTNVKKNKIRQILDNLAVEYAGGRRGVTLDEVTGGYQLRTKIDNMNFLKRTVKAKPFKLSGPALETLAIVAYKQPVVKNEIDQIRGVESGHLLRALMEKGLCHFEGKAENLPGRPMQYGTTRRFLEIFGLRNLKELPTLSQIDELLPEGIGEEEEQKPTLASVTDAMSENVESVSYSVGEEELGKIEEELGTISTSSEFFEQEKIRQKQKRDAEKAQDIRDAMAVGENVSKRDLNWLKKYEESLAMAEQGLNVPQTFVEDAEAVAEAQASESQIEEIEQHIEDEIPFFAEADDDSAGEIIKLKEEVDGDLV